MKAMMNNIRKKLFALMLLSIVFVPIELFACDVCQNNQPKILKGITHGTGPQGNIDYVIIWSAVVIVSVTLFLSVKFLVRPKENNPNHVKNIVLN